MIQLLSAGQCFLVLYSADGNMRTLQVRGRDRPVLSNALGKVDMH